MAPPTATFNLDVEAISGICGSVSIACWIVVFSPQIIQNFQRSSADALSVQFIIVWLVGDAFNILGAVMQGVLPTMIILAIYYTIADIVLLAQLFYYRGFVWKDEPVPTMRKTQRQGNDEPDERTDLLAATRREGHGQHRERRESDWSALSPAVPHFPDAPPPPGPPSALQTVAWNTLIVLMVVAAGVAGWYLGQRTTGGKKKESRHDGDDVLEFSTLGQIFGYLCAVAYIASRLPQLILNYRRKTTEGLSMLFFLFACLGNITYVLSIFAFEPRCSHRGDCDVGEARRTYGRYMLVNLSWLAGSALTLVLDLGVFAQYFIYKTADGEDIDGDPYLEDDRRDSYDGRPILRRDESNYP